MPSFDSHQQSRFVKICLIGNSGAGKTGALTSLVRAGYELRIIDLDAGLDALYNHVKAECPDLLSSIQFHSFRDAIKMTPTGPRSKGAPKAYVNTLAALETWSDDNSDPAEWGPKKILVLDSLTNVGRAAMLWAKATNPTTKDPRQWFSTAQSLVEDLIANLTSDDFKTNVIVISHIEIMENSDGVKGYISSIGKALGPKLPRFFNTLIVSQTKGTGKNLKRILHTMPTAMVDAKNPAPMKIEAEYEIQNGLAEIFAKLSD